MKCKRCGKILPNEEYICPHCGLSIKNNSSSQNASNINLRPGFISEKYGNQKQLYQPRENSEQKNYIFVLILIVLLIIILISIIVYFF